MDSLTLFKTKHRITEWKSINAKFATEFTVTVEETRKSDMFPDINTEQLFSLRTGLTYVSGISFVYVTSCLSLYLLNSSP